MTRNVLVTGATGFTGRHVVPLLLARYGKVACFVRPTSDRSTIGLPGVSFCEGDLRDQGSLEAALEGKDALISIAYLANCAPAVIGSCRAAGVRRGVFMSSTSIYTTLPAPAKAAKLAAEDAVMRSGLDYTILRPTMIYGTPADRNMHRLIRYLRRWPVVFVPGSGEFQQQPVHVEDVAGAVVRCLDTPATVGKAYNLSGAEPLTFNQVLDHVCLAMGVRRAKMRLPLRPALWAARLSHRWGGRRWIKEEQLLRLNENKCFDHLAAHDDFGFSPRSFAEGIRQQVTGSQ